VLLWFVGTSVLSVWYVFRDPNFDYRLLIVGALLPDVIDIWNGRARWAHSLAFAVVLMVAVMVATIGRRPLRKMLLGLPIGVMLHLVWDGAFASEQVFWWPLSGDWGDVRLFSLDRSWLINVLMELAGLAAITWMWRRFGLADPAAQRQLVRSGRLRAPLSVGPTDSGQVPTC
jgi:hypothetical protein